MRCKAFEWNHLPVAGGIYAQDPMLFKWWDIIFREEGKERKREEERRQQEAKKRQQASASRGMSRRGRRR